MAVFSGLSEGNMQATARRTVVHWCMGCGLVGVVAARTSARGRIATTLPGGATRSPSVWGCSGRAGQTIGRGLSSSASVSKIRNVGIMAHIDAGKTTLTERILFYANVLRRCGEVHEGDTIMDFMDQERERGITIQAAAISFPWRDLQFNLIDTPGHVDFTIEVERSLRVLDGAVAVFDGVAGVEAQSETVWRQANRYAVPRLVFINKLDREGADPAITINSIAQRLQCTPMVLQIPLGKYANFQGVVDLLRMEALFFDADGEGSSARAGAAVARIPLSAHDAAAELGARGLDADEVGREAAAAREALIEVVADFDDAVMEAFLEGGASSVREAGCDRARGSWADRVKVREIDGQETGATWAKMRRL